ncbi:MAG: pseudouridine synthase [Arcicella sp.]|nr:pseudouridine synthase [Arcicella sp.]
MRKRIEKEDLNFERREQTRQRKDELNRELGREVPKRKTYGGDDRSENRGFSENRGERREFNGERRSENRGYSENRGERREFNGERSENRSERKPYGERSENIGERREFKSDERKPYRERSENRGERREFNSGDRKPYGERSENRGERREFNSGDRKPYGERSENRGERRDFNSGERKLYGERSENGGERREFNGERRSDNRGERREFNRDERSERRPYSENRGERRDFNSGERKPYGERSENRGERRDFNSGERKPYGERSERRDFNGERSERKDFNRDEKRPFNGRREEGSDKRKPVAKRFDKGDFNKPRPNNFSDKPFEQREDKKGKFEGEKPERKKTEKTYGSAKANFGGKNLFKAHRPVEESDKWTPTYKIGGYKDTAPKKVQKKIEESEKKNSSDIRLNRYIANAGICSRREADDLIKAGEIKVNGNIVTEMGYQVKPGDVVKYGNRKLNREKMVYVLVNKPKDFITTTEDPDDRKTVMDLVKNACEERIYPVGRLDRNTTGLLLLTNDGELADKLTHPSNEVEKLYQVEINKPLTTEHFEQILKGITLEDGEIKADELGIVTPDGMVVGVKIHSGRNRIVRRIFESLGYEVLKLDRTTFAGLNKKDLPRGSWRFLTEKEVVKLKFFI